jgi:hypothetical protein
VSRRRQLLLLPLLPRQPPQLLLADPSERLSEQLALREIGLLERIKEEKSLVADLGQPSTKKPSAVWEYFHLVEVNDTAIDDEIKMTAGLKKINDSSQEHAGPVHFVYVAHWWRDNGLLRFPKNCVGRFPYPCKAQRECLPGTSFQSQHLCESSPTPEHE